MGENSTVSQVEPIMFPLGVDIIGRGAARRLSYFLVKGHSASYRGHVFLPMHCC